MYTMNEIEYNSLSTLVSDFCSDKPKLKLLRNDKPILKLDNTLTNLKTILALCGYELVSMMIFETYATVLDTETDKFYNIQIETN